MPSLDFRPGSPPLAVGLLLSERPVVIAVTGVFWVSSFSALLLPVVLAVTVAAAAQANKTSEPFDLARVVAGMEQAQRTNHERAQAYTVTREYRLYANNEESPASSVVASISFIPPNEKTFTIQASEGSDRVTQIVRHILENEAQAAKKQSPTISRENYDFSLAGEELLNGSPCWVLNLQPKHAEKDLVNGKTWVDKRTYQIHRVEGDLSKTPSWWLKKVHLAIDFGDAEGLWLQKDSRAVADVRMFGSHVLTGESLTVRTAKETARANQPSNPAPTPVNDDSRPGTQHKQTRRRPPASPVFGAAVLTPQ